MKESNAVNTFVVDTNVFVRISEDSTTEHGRLSKSLLKAARDNKINIVINSLIISEISWVLSSFYSKDKTYIWDFIYSLLGISGINKIESYSLENYLESWQENSAKLVDNMIATIPEVVQGEWGVVTFDKEFKQFKNIKVYTPSELLAQIG